MNKATALLPVRDIINKVALKVAQPEAWRPRMNSAIRAPPGPHTRRRPRRRSAALQRVYVAYTV